MSEISKELRLWAKDDIVPSDLQALCKKAADSQEALVKACKKGLKLAQMLNHPDEYHIEAAITAGEKEQGKCMN